jgi:TRAP-type C4-dicarboxylate transport system substrate-binding protein
MHDVLPEPQMLSLPMFFTDEAELECTFAKSRAKVEAAFEAKNYVVLQWSRIGAMSMFCDKPFRTPAEMGAAGAKVFAWEGDPKSVDAWRAAGFRPVVLSSTDVVPSLQTGMIDCITNVPLYILTTRLFEKANHMVDLPWGFIYGATIVRKDAWEKIAPETRTKLQAIAVELGAKVDIEVRRLNVDAVAAMKKQGLQVVSVDAKPWREAMEKSYPVVRGGVVPAAWFDEVKVARDQCRAGKNK